jgi:uncharacterized membrane protein YcaP (DUF421 family)
MEIVLRGVIIYFTLFILFRVGGKRIVNSRTPFGLVLVLLVSSAVADALKDEDRSLTGGIILAATLIGIHLLMSMIKSGNHRATRIIDDVPTLLVRDGKIDENSLKKSNVNEEDILAAGRQQKITRIDDIQFAILEIDGSISIIEKKEEK